MISFFKRSIEPNKKLRTLEIIVLALLFVGSVFCYGKGIVNLNSKVGDLSFKGTVEMVRDRDEEDYDEDCTVCDVTFTKDDATMIVSYSYEEYEALEIDFITAYEFETSNGTQLFFDHKDVKDQEIKDNYKAVMASESSGVFNTAIALSILLVSLLVVFLFSTHFTTYEKSWFTSIMVLATIVAVLVPEESANGVNGIIIMLLYLLDTFLNILCELLISKQSRWNFIVSLAVEITEILICVVLMYRFATMATTLFFWIPIDIISFINWSKHKDDVEDELTVVRRLKGYQEVLIILFIIVWTIVVGYFLSGLDITTDFIQNRSIAVAIAYLDACASAVGAANGLFILFRLREQWIAWYACAFLESIINIISGQFVLLVLKLGYFTNTTYGYIKWSRYIKTHKEDNKTLF